MCPPNSDAEQRRAFARRAEASDGGHRRKQAAPKDGLLTLRQG
jgi:hypothetical protein